jgi:hypothetical protein
MLNHEAADPIHLTSMVPPCLQLNLEVEEVGWVRQRLQQGWKENLHQPVIIDVALVQQPHHDTRAAGVSAEPYRVRPGIFV